MAEVTRINWNGLSIDLEELPEEFRRIMFKNADFGDVLNLLNNGLPDGGKYIARMVKDK